MDSKELIRIEALIKDASESISALISQEGEEKVKHSKRESALLDENEKLKSLLDHALVDMDSIKEEAMKAQELIKELEASKECLEHRIDELKIEKREKEAKKAELGKYRQHEEKSAYEPKKGFRIKEEE